MLRIVGNDSSESPWMECMLRIVGNDSSESPWMEWLKIAPCIFRTSHIHVGRMLRIVGNDSSALFIIHYSFFIEMLFIS
jgi:hypothetical protein